MSDIDRLCELLTENGFSVTIYYAKPAPAWSVHIASTMSADHDTYKTTYAATLEEALSAAIEWWAT